MKKYIAIILSFVLIKACGVFTYAEEDTPNEQSGISVVRKMADSNIETVDELSYSEIETIL